MSIIGPLLAKPGTNGRDPVLWLCLERFVELLMISYSFSQLLFVLREVFFFKGTNLWFWQRACDLEHGDLHLKCKELKLIWLLFPNNHCIFLYIHFAQFSTLLSFRLKNCNCISTNLSVLGMLRGLSCYSRKVSLKITTTQFSKGAKKASGPEAREAVRLDLGKRDGHPMGQGHSNVLCCRKQRWKVSTKTAERTHRKSLDVLKNLKSEPKKGFSAHILGPTEVENLRSLRSGRGCVDLPRIRSVVGDMRWRQNRPWFFHSNICSYSLWGWEPH